MNDEERALYKLSTPIPLTNLMVNRPCCMILVGLVIMFLISFLTFYLDYLTATKISDRDYMVWGDPYVTNFDKSIGVSRELLLQTNEEGLAPLQSQANPDWTVLLVYSSPDDTQINLWTKDVLIGIREFEKDIQVRDDYKQACLAKYEEEAMVGCDSEGFLSALDFFPNPQDLENMTEE